MSRENGNRYGSRLEPGLSDFSSRRKALHTPAEALRRPETFFGEEDDEEAPEEEGVSPAAPALTADLVRSDLERLDYGPEEIEEILSGRWQPPAAGRSVASGVVGKPAARPGIPKASSAGDGAGEYRGFPLVSVMGSVLDSFTKKDKG